MATMKIGYHPDHRRPGGFIQVPEGIRKQHYRSHFKPADVMSINGIDEEHRNWLKQGARDNNMSVSVFMSFLAEMLHEGRVLVLPPNYSIDSYIDGRFRELMEKESEKILLRIIGKTGLAEPYRR